MSQMGAYSKRLTVIEHSHNKSDGERNGKLAAVVRSEDPRWAQRIFAFFESLPNAE